jgi:hypothetical protein
MNRNSENFSGRSLMVYVAIAVAIFANSAAYAQRVALEPATAVGAAATKAMTVITKPGSYVLSRNLTVTRSGIDGVLINSSNVTLNLQGFVITGNSNADNGIEVAAGVNNVVIADGIITGFGGAGVLAGQGTNISALTVQGNGTGITCGIGSLVQSNIIQGNTGIGLTISDATGGYLGNIFQMNNQNTSPGASGQVTGGTSLGHNLCNGLAC